MDTWIIWLIVALGIAIVEMILPGLSLICLSVGGVAAAVMAYFHYGFTSQLVAFIFASLLAFFLIRPFIRLIFFKNKKMEDTNVSGLVGQKGKVVRSIPEKESGWVKVMHEEWAASSEDGRAIPEGKEIIVIKVEGNSLIVKGV